MSRKVYILNDNIIYTGAACAASHNFRSYINKRVLQTYLHNQKKYNKQSKKVSSFYAFLIFVAVHYLLVGVIILLSKLGI